MDINYKFTIEVGPTYYSEQTDEDFCDTEDVYYTLEVSESQIIDALIDMYTTKDKSIKEKYKEILNELDMNNFYNEESIDEILKEKEDLVYLINKDLIFIEYYLNSKIEDYLKKYFRDYAYDKFLEN